jgi:hypothetical protein
MIELNQPIACRIGDLLPSLLMIPAKESTIRMYWPCGNQEDYTLDNVHELVARVAAINAR